LASQLVTPPQELQHRHLPLSPQVHPAPQPYFFLAGPGRHVSTE
jgi:hypothetical protein